MVNNFEASSDISYLPKIHIREYCTESHCDNCANLDVHKNILYFHISNKINIRNGIVFFYNDIQVILLQAMNVTIDDLNITLLGNIIIVKKN
jgi:hypothetical protein